MCKTWTNLGAIDPVGTNWLLTYFSPEPNAIVASLDTVLGNYEEAADLSVGELTRENEVKLLSEQ